MVFVVTTKYSMKKKTVYQIFKKHSLPNSKIKLSLICKFDHDKKIWNFSGYRCLHCDKRLVKEKIDEHRENCEFY